MRRIIGICSLCIAFSFIVNGQTSLQNSPILIEKLDNYSKSNPTSLLFVHTDKTLYTNNETIWFSAYLIKDRTSYYKDHTILSVAMIREDSREVVLQSKYLMADGLSFGSLNLPDSIPPGNYKFIAFTNVLNKNNQPIAAFEQSITIKSITQQDFNVTLNLLDTVITNETIRAQVNVSLKDTKSKERPILEYSVGKERNKPVILKENSFLIAIPVKQLNQSQPVLLTSVKYNKQVQYLSIKLLEIKAEGIRIRFFPEGGNLVSELESTIGWEAQTYEGLPVALSGILYRDAQPIDTISTNSYGIGKFSIKPENDKNYILKVAANAFLKKDTSYTLPKALGDGLIMQLPDAVTGDSLRVNIYSKFPKSVQVLVHDYQKAYASFQTEIRPSGTRLKIALPALPKGLSTVTILDEQGKPLAERLFFAHYNRKISVESLPDQADYKKRDSVKIKIRLTDQDGIPVQGIISAAVVQDNRVENSKQQDIESYAYLNHDLGNLPKDPAGRGFNNKSYIEDILLVKGWRRFTWQDLANSIVIDTSGIHSTSISGKVKFNRKPISKPVMLTVMRDSIFDMISTLPDGSFPITADHFLINEGRKALASVNEKNKASYTIDIEDPFAKTNEQLAKQIKPQATGIARSSLSSDELELEGIDRTIALNEVIVKGDRGSPLYGKRGPKGSNNCGDYVDDWGYLNFAPSAGRSTNTQPITGQQYRIRTDVREEDGTTWFTVKPIIYRGCLTKESSEIFDISKIYLAREFYGINKDDVPLPEPQFLSTLFWKPGIITNKQGETEFSFITGDIKGPFRIVIQGIGMSDMIFGESSFTVH